MALRLRHFIYMCGLALLLPLAACGDDSVALEDAYQWLGSYYKDNPPNKGAWKLLRIERLEGGLFNIAVAVEDEKHLMALANLARMRQMEIARLACPQVGSAFWDIAPSGSAISITLYNGELKIIGAQCAS